MRIYRIPLKSALAASAMAIGLSASPAQAQERYIGEIMQTGYTFCPRETASLDGQLMAISSNTALFSLIGTIYGGDGRTTFALPDMRSRVPMHNGTGPGLSPRTIGQRFGSEQYVLTVNNMPAHSHNPRMRVSRINASTRNPINAYMARATDNVFEEGTEPTGDLMAASAIISNNVGANIPVDNIQPVQVNRYCIVLFGIYPSRS